MKKKTSSSYWCINECCFTQSGNKTKSLLLGAKKNVLVREQKLLLYRETQAIVVHLVFDL